MPLIIYGRTRTHTSILTNFSKGNKKDVTKVDLLYNMHLGIKRTYLMHRQYGAPFT